MGVINIPATEEALKAGLDGLDGLLTAKEWERAAIVYAWTTNDSKGGRPASTGTAREVVRFTIRGFVGLDISGLRTQDSVRSYRDAWERAVEAGLAKADIKPGDEVTLPDMEWKTTYSQRNPGVGPNSAADVPAYLERKPEVVKAYMVKHPEVVAEAIKSVPAIAEVVVDDEEAASEISARTFTKNLTGQQVGRVAPAMAKTTNPLKPLHDAISVISTFILNEQKGVAPDIDGTTETRLRLLTISLNERVARMDGAAVPDTLSSIAAYLKETTK